MLLDSKPTNSIYYFVSWTSSVHIPQITYLLCLKEKKIPEKLYLSYIYNTSYGHRHIVSREFLLCRGN